MKVSKVVPHGELLHSLHFACLFHDVELSSVHLRLYLATRFSAASSALASSLTFGIPGPSIDNFHEDVYMFGQQEVALRSQNAVYGAE